MIYRLVAVAWRTIRESRGHAVVEIGKYHIDLLGVHATELTSADFAFT
jgi:hypothetical protein